MKHLSNVIVITLATISIHACTTQLKSIAAKKQEIQNLQVELLPGRTYQIEETWFSKSNTSRSNYEYIFKIEVESLSKIIVQTIDTTFAIDDYSGLRPKINHTNLFKRGDKDGPTFCHSLDGKHLIASDSINLYHNSNTFNQNAIRSWNRQNQISIENAELGDTLLMNTFNSLFGNTQAEFPTTYIIKSIEENIVYITLERAIYDKQLPEKLIRTEKGEINYDHKNKFFTKIEEYSFDAGNTMFSSYYKTAIELNKNKN